LFQAKAVFESVFWLANPLPCAPYGNKKPVPLNNLDDEAFPSPGFYLNINKLGMLGIDAGN